MTELLLGKDLKQNQCQALLNTIFSTQSDEGLTESLLLLLRKKGESVGEIRSFVDFAKKHALSFHAPLPFLTDFCGTGGDQKHTFNISTLASLVAAGAGAYVAKHGNRSISSQCGSSDLMEKLGVNLAINPRKASEILAKTHFVYLHAPFFHPIFKRVHAARQKLKTKTLFNFLGPLLNPACARHQIIGVSEPSLLNVYPEVLLRSSTEHAWIFRDEKGYDEISLTGNVEARQIFKGKVLRRILRPEHFGFKNVDPKFLESSGASESLDIARKILAGKDRGARRDVVLANTALGLVASGRAYHIKEAMALARFSLETGRAKQVLEKVIELSQ